MEALAFTDRNLQLEAISSELSNNTRTAYQKGWSRFMDSASSAPASRSGASYPTRRPVGDRAFALSWRRGEERIHSKRLLAHLHLTSNHLPLAVQRRLPYERVP